MKSVNEMELSPLTRRHFLRRAALLGAGSLVGGSARRSFGADAITLPFENGERPLVQYPQKRPMIRLTTRPPQLETPFEVFNDGVITPNDAFFVRYHLANSPPAVEEEKFRLRVVGQVKTPLTLSIAELKSQFEPIEIVAVNQCSGNSRGFSQPRVPGGQMGHGAMGNARWKGVRLKDVLARTRLDGSARQVTFDGLDKAPQPTIPDFVKALEVDHALDGEVMLAYEMNGEPLPWLNGYPLRLVVPGHFGTYWIKHLHEIKVFDHTFDGYWMNPAYRIPDNACACVEPGTTSSKTVPITHYNVRSFLTSLQHGARIKALNPVTVRGIAFDGGYGIREVIWSSDDGRTWREAELGRDHGKYSFREWTSTFLPEKAGTYSLKVKATNRIGQSQPLEALWNPAGYMRNAVETVEVIAV